MRIDHGCGDVAVSEELLDGPDIGSAFEEMGREGVAEGVAGGGFGDTGDADGLLDPSLEYGFVKMMATCLTRVPIDVEPGCREDPLPGPFGSGARVLPG